ncbi:MAG: hypothetical protein ACI8ZM_002893 [Crocinitomix sp.]
MSFRWEAVEFAETICEAMSSAQAPPDMTNLDFLNPPQGVLGNPYAGDLFLSGNYASLVMPEYVFIRHEDIKQFVTEFTPGCTYEVSFFNLSIDELNWEWVFGNRFYLI